MVFLRGRNERGTALVESALVLFTFVLILFAIMEAARFMSVRQTLADSVREGVRLAITPAAGTSTLPTTNEIETRVRVFLNSNGLGAATVSVNPAKASTVAGTTDVFTEVRVQFPYQLLTVSLFSSLSVTLTETVQMRNETSS